MAHRCRRSSSKLKVLWPKRPDSQPINQGSGCQHVIQLETQKSGSPIPAFSSVGVCSLFANLNIIRPTLVSLRYPSHTSLVFLRLPFPSYHHHPPTENFRWVAFNQILRTRWKNSRSRTPMPHTVSHFLPFLWILSNGLPPQDHTQSLKRKRKASRLGR